jgi:hypothetical protein
MSFDRDLWLRIFPNDAIPPFPCPTCSHGHLVLMPGTLHEVQSTHNARLKSHDGWEPDWIQEQFVLLLQCSVEDCGEIVSVCGSTRVVEVTDDEHGWIYIGRLVPRAMWPAPRIIEIPSETPETVVDALKSAFSFFWTDMDACANRIRTSVERVMDELKIPAERITKAGKTLQMVLADRITALKALDPDHAETMDALRYIGNLGTHGGEVTLEALLDAFHIYEDALAELYGRRRDKVKALRTKIIAAKGKYP